MTDQMDNNYGVLLFEKAWEELGDALKDYQYSGPIGKYLYCNKLEYGIHFVTMIFTPEQVSGEIDCKMRISVPSSFVKFIAEGADSDRARIGFRPE